MRRHGIPVGMVGVVLAVSLTVQAQAATPGKNGKLAYQIGDGVAVGFVLPEVGDEVLLHENADDPRWSPDGTWIVLTILSDEVQDQIATIRADGTDLDVLTTTDALDSGRAAWSPDATRIAFDRYNLAGDRERLMIMRADGSGVKPLTSPGMNEYDYSPVWSPDGRTIAFVSEIGSTKDIDLIAPDGTRRRSFAATGADEDRPAWSPDGSRIAYERDGDIVVKPVGGGPVVTIIVAARRPEWSPDGRWIIYTAERATKTGDVSGIYKRRSNATGEEVLISPPGARNGVWQPRCDLAGDGGPDSLTGTARPELICGRGGRDTIDGRGGTDIVFAGPGDDIVMGGDGGDVLVGQTGYDRFDGGPGRDRCVQGPGSGAKVRCES